MTSTTDVIIEGSRFLIPFDDKTTVAELTQVAFSEWQSCNKRGFRQVRLVRDSESRILPRFLKIVDLKDRNHFEIIVDDFNKEDVTVTESDELLSQYRCYQLHTLQQIQDSILISRLATIDHEISESDAVMISELGQTPSESVQLAVLKILNSIFFKFTRKKTCRFAAKQLIRLYNTSTFAEVVVAILNCLLYASSNLVHLFGQEDLKALAIEDSLVKFPSLRSTILKTVADIHKNIEFSERETGYADRVHLLPIFAYAPASEFAKSPSTVAMAEEKQLLDRAHRPDDGKKKIPFIRYLVSDRLQLLYLEVAATEPSSIAHSNPLGDSPAKTQPQNNSTLSRLLSLIISDEIPVRRFGLEKLYSRLLQSKQQILKLALRGKDSVDHSSSSQEHFADDSNFDGQGRQRGSAAALLSSGLTSNDLVLITLRH